jgi:hypothetical protein
MQKLSALFIASLFIFQAFYNLGLTVYWLSNHAYIAAVLCENRDKPALKCDGKCYLRKKMAAAQQETAPKQNTPVKKELKSSKFSEFIVANPWQGKSVSFFHNPLIATIPDYSALEAVDPIFHPPAAQRA